MESRSNGFERIDAMNELFQWSVDSRVVNPTCFHFQVVREEIPRCDSCDNLTKPDIVFFGENLPGRFFSAVNNDLPKCDLLIIMGTSLVVQPFASMIDRVSENQE